MNDLEEPLNPIDQTSPQTNSVRISRSYVDASGKLVSETSTDAEIDAFTKAFLQDPGALRDTSITTDADGFQVNPRMPQSIDLPKGDAVNLSGGKVAPGLAEEQKFRMAGFSEDEISENRTQEIQKMKGAGFSDQEIQDYYGIKEPDMSALKTHFTANLDAFAAAEKEKSANSEVKTPPSMKKATTWKEAFEAGFQTSVDGLILRGKSPDVTVADDASLAMKIASTIGQLQGDLPAMVAGWHAGAIAGAPIGGALGSVIPGAGTLAGIATGYGIGGVGGAWAAPAAMREALMQHYTLTGSSRRDFVARTMGVAWEGSKGFLTGLATELVGAAAGAKALGLTGKQLVSDAARFSAEVPTMTLIGRGLEGELPDRDDFIVGGITLGGFHGAKAIGSKLMSIYRETGIKPDQVLNEAKNNVELRQELIAEDSGIVPYAPTEVKPTEPKAPTLVEQAKSLSTAYFKDAYQNFFDSLAPTKEISEQTYKLLDFQKTWKSKAYRMTEFETVDFAKQKPNGEAFKSIVIDGLKAVEGKEVSEAGSAILSRMDPEIVKRSGNESKLFSAYLVARTAIERAAKTPDKATGIDVEAAKKFVAEHKTALEPVAKRFTEFEQRILDYGRDAGLFTEEGVKAMKAAHENHASLARLMDEDPLTGQRSKGSPVKKFKGNSERLVLDPVKTAVENMSAIVRAAEENRSRLHIAKELENHPNAKELGEIVSPDVTATRVQPKEVQEWLKEHKMAGVDLPDQPFDVFRRVHGDLASNEIQYFENGKRKVLRLRQDIADGIKSLDYDPGSSSLVIRTAMAIGRASAQFAKKSITMSMAFGERNIFRDQFDKIINDKARELPLMPSLQALDHIFKEDEVFRRYLSSGGLTEGFYDYAKYHEQFAPIVEKQGIKSQLWNLVKTPVHAYRLYEKLLNAFEQAPRIATAKSEGLMNGDFQSLLDSGYASKEATVNFLKVGLKTKAVAPLFKFLTPGLAGIERTTRGLGDAEVWNRGFYAMTIPTIVNWMANKDDSRYKSIPNYKLATGWPIITDEWVPAVNQRDWSSRPEDLRRVRNGQYEVNNGSIYFIPKPPGYGTIFATLPEAVLNSYYKTHKDPFDGFGGSIFEAYMPDMQVNLIAPFQEMKANQNFFTKNPIVPYHMKELLPELQWTTYTSETAKQLGKLIGASPLAGEIGQQGLLPQSPLVVDTFIRDWTGPTGVMIVGLVDKALHAARVGNTSPEPYSALTENPYINGFVYRYPNARTQDVEEFYKRYSIGSAAVLSFRKSLKAGDDKLAQEIKEKYGPQMIRLNTFNESLSSMHKTIQAITLGAGDFKDMGPIEKRQAIDTIYYEMWQTAKTGNQLMDEFEANYKKETGR